LLRAGGGGRGVQRPSAAKAGRVRGFPGTVVQRVQNTVVLGAGWLWRRGADELRALPAHPPEAARQERALLQPGYQEAAGGAPPQLRLLLVARRILLGFLPVVKPTLCS